MNEQPLISVIVPVYNVEKYLPRCIESIVSQTYKNLEIILVDDGSSDCSFEICSQYAKKDNRIVVIRQSNGGVSSARNKALECAKGEYIAFVDSDDFIDKEMIAILYENLIENNCQISICSFKFFDDTEVKNDKQTYEKFTSTAEETIENVLLGKHYSGHLCNKLFCRNVLEGLRFDENICVSEDAVFVCEALCKIEKSVFESKPLYYYYVRDDSACHKAVDEKFLTVLTACEKIEKIFSQYLNKKLISFALAHTLNWIFALLEKMYSNRQLDKKYFKKIQKEIRKRILLGGFKHLKFKRIFYMLLAVFSIEFLFWVRRLVE